MPQVNVRQEVFDKIRSRMKYGDSWSDFINRMLDNNDCLKVAIKDMQLRIVSLEHELESKR